MQINLKPWREDWLLYEIIAVMGRWQSCQEQIKERAYNLLCWQSPYVGSHLLQLWFFVAASSAGIS